jgi:hypothetical protein
VNREEALEIWAPHDSRWGAWTKPTLFSFMSDPLPDRAELADRGWRVGLSLDTAILVELAGQEAVFVGLQLARSGYRPVPLFNACPSGLEESRTAIFPSKTNFAPALVDVRSIIQALERNTNLLKSLSLPESAPPAFLLDANRSNGPLFPDPGIFDNRSVVRESDLPNGEILKETGIRRVVLIRTANTLGRDLRPILLSWQTAGLRIQTQEPGSEWNPRDHLVRRPAALSVLLDKLVMGLSFRTNSQGSFGRTVHSAGG